MAKTIDERVVSLNFNNARFEEGVRQSLSTLQRLKEATSSKAVGAGLTSLNDAARKVDLTPIAAGIDAIQNRFSTLGIVGMTVIQDLTRKAISIGGNLLNAVMGPIKEGGFSRAMKLENAEFMLDGLLKDSARVEEVMKNVKESVDGTAYGLDAAASTASQLVASGVQEGEQLTGVLKSVAGVAAITNTSFEEIGGIMSTVYGQGKLMTMQLRQLEARGMNAAATMAEYFGTTEDNIREMVTKGQVSADMFAEAMSTFSDQAGKANETFEGSLANVRSALGRTGAAFYAPFLKRNSPLIEFFNTLRIKINEMNNSEGMAKIVEWFTEDFTSALQWAQKVVDSFDIQGMLAGFAHLYDAAESIAMIINNRVLEPLRYAFKDVNLPTMDGFVEFTRKVSEFFATMKDQSHNFGFSSILRGIIATVQIATRVFKDFWEVIAPLRSAAADVFSTVVYLLGNFGLAIEMIKEDLDGTENIFSKFASLFETIGSKIASVSQWIRWEWGGDDLYERIYESLKGIGGAFSSFGNLVSGIAKNVAGFTSVIFSGGVFQTLSSSVKSVVDRITPLLNRAKEAVLNFFRAFTGETAEMDASEKFGKRFDTFSRVLEAFLNVIKKVGGVVKSVLSPAIEAIKKFVKTLTLDDAISMSWVAIGASVGGALTRLLHFLTEGQAISNRMQNKGFLTMIFGEDFGLIPIRANQALTELGNVLISFNSALKTALDLAFIKTVATSIAILAGAIAVLAFIPSDKITNAAVGLAYAMGILVGGIAALKKVMATATGISVGPFIALVLGMSLAMSLLAGAVVKMGKASGKGELVSGLIGLVVSLIALVGAVKLASLIALDIDLKGLALFLVIAFAVSSISKAVARLAKTQDTADNAMAVVAMLYGLIMAVMAVAAILTYNTTDVSSLFAFSAIIFSITLLVKQIKGLAKLDTKGVMTAVGAIMAMLLSVAGFIALLGFIFRRGGGIGGGGLGVAFDLTSIAVYMIAMAVAMRILASSIKALAVLKPENLAQGVGAIVVVLVALAAACFVMSKSILGAVAIAAIAAALALLTPILIAIGGVFSVVILGILGLAAALTVLSVAAIILAPYVLFFVVFAIGLTALGIAAGVLGAGLMILNTAILTFAGAAAGFVNALKLVLVTIADTIPYVAAKLVEGIVMFFTTLAESKVKILSSIASLILSILELLITFIPAFAQLTVTFLITVVQTILTYLPVIVDTLFHFVVGLINGLADAIRNNADEIFAAVNNLLSALLEFILEGINQILGKIPGIGGSISSMIEGAQGGIHKFFTGNELTKEVDKGVDAIASAAETGKGTMETAGGGLGDSLLSGFTSKLGGENGASGLLDSVTGMLSGGEVEFGAVGQKLGGSFNDGLMSSIGLGEDGGSLPAVDTLISGFNEGNEKMVDVGEGYGDSILGGIETQFDEFDPTQLASSFNVDFLAGVENAQPSPKDTGKEIASEVTTGLEEGMVDVAAPGGEALAEEINSGFVTKSTEVAKESGKEYVNQTVDGIEEATVETAIPAGEELAEEINVGLENKHEDTRSAGKTLGSEGAKGARSSKDEWISSGEDSADGYVIGIKNKETAARNAGSFLASVANAGTKTTAKINSPSELWMEDGEMSGLGYALGIESTAADAKKAGSSLVDNARFALVNGFGDLGAEAGVRFSPVVDYDSVKSNLAMAGNINLKNAELATTSMLNADVNAKLMADNQIAELKKQQELTMVQNGIQQQILSALGNIVGQQQVLEGIRAAIGTRQDVVLDTGVIVGALAPKMDAALGVRATRAARGMR